MKSLLVSGSTNEVKDWDIVEILKPTPSYKVDRDRMVEYDWDNRIAKNGMTYLEIEQFNNTFNL